VSGARKELQVPLNAISLSSDLRHGGASGMTASGVNRCPRVGCNSRAPLMALRGDVG
jgi:hypothetical protein